MVMTFDKYYDNKNYKSLKKLKTIAEILSIEGFEVKDQLHREEPYVYIYTPKKNLSFDGIRLYEIGNQIVFRVQKEVDTQPYGRAYPIDVDKLYEKITETNTERDDESKDSPSQDMNNKDKKNGQKLASEISKIVKSFFNNSAQAEVAERDLRIRDPIGRLHIRSATGTDYADRVQDSSSR